MSSTEQALFDQIIYAAFLIPFVLGCLLIWFLVFYLKRKHKSELERKDLLLKQQSLLIEKQRAVEHERNRIAAEMHDDLGSGLTRIKYLSERALRITDDQREYEQIQRIADQSNTLVTNMSEIIWAMNSRFDTAESLTGYIRRYASEYLEENSIPLTFNAGSIDANTPVTAEKRRNIFLVVKEVLHNTVKYAQAQSVDITMDAREHYLNVIITEKHAVGFNPEAMQEKGNGLYNMQKRMHTIGGRMDFKRDGEDMIIHLGVPLEA
jgi:signal transduction histidine kinase